MSSLWGLWEPASKQARGFSQPFATQPCDVSSTFLSPDPVARGRGTKERVDRFLHGN